MKLDRRDFLIASSSALLLTQGIRTGKAAVPDTPKTEAAKMRTATVYTTAKDSGQRISASGAVAFTPMGQPLETQICVFVDPGGHFRRSSASAARSPMRPPKRSPRFRKTSSARSSMRTSTRRRHRLHAGTDEHPQLRFLLRQLHLRRRRRQGAEVVQRRARPAVPHSIHQAGDRDRRRKAARSSPARGVRRHS